ncbi:hypothetical protein SK128_017935 [Halocaridina rubra]|uniref:Uncharacterized protein n=1 Tax=Halocaridina rubra TaxID=373956 RepID=A0AAN9A2D1_HALRR
MDKTKELTTTKSWKVVMSPRKLDEYCKEILSILNEGTVRKLQQLPTIGPKTAMVIYNYRQMFGRFSAVEDLADIPALPRSFYTRFMKADPTSRISWFAPGPGTELPR